MVTQFTVATANAQFDRLILTKNGFKNIAEVDVLLLQEVSDPDKHHLDDTLNQVGFEVIYTVGTFGLAIALRRNSDLRVIAGTQRAYEYAKFNLLERFLIAIAAPGRHEFKRRGMISVKLQTKDNRIITMATTHPAINMTPKSRAQQIKKIKTELMKDYYNGSLILGGDMNHHPGPQSVDMDLWQAIGLQPIDLNGQVTWITRKSKLLLPARLLGIFNRQTPEDHDGQLDDILYRGIGLKCTRVRVIDIPSDHNAIVANFSC